MNHAGSVRRILLLLLAGAGLVAGCNVMPGSGTSKGDAYIYAVSPRTGSHAYGGDDVAGGAKLRAWEANRSATTRCHAANAMAPSSVFAMPRVVSAADAAFKNATAATRSGPARISGGILGSGWPVRLASK